MTDGPAGALAALLGGDLKYFAPREEDRLVAILECVSQRICDPNNETTLAGLVEHHPVLTPTPARAARRRSRRA